MTGTALIVGASRGLGLGLAREYLDRGWTVIATARDPAGAPGLAKLKAAAGDGLQIERADVIERDSVAALARRLEGGALDLLFVVAGIGGPPEIPITEVSPADFAHVMNTNALGPVCTAEALVGLVRPDGVVAFMSSGLGSVANNTTGVYEAYRASKAALNMLVRSAARRLGEERAVLLMAPGWVRTDMGGPDAPLDVETSVRGLATVIDARRGHGGCAFVDIQDRDIPW